MIKVHELLNGPSIVSYAKHARCPMPDARFLLNCATCFKFSAKILPHIYIYMYVHATPNIFINALRLPNHPVELVIAWSIKNILFCGGVSGQFTRVSLISFIETISHNVCRHLV